MTTTTALTPEQKLTLVKHLAGGKTPDVVATIMHTSKDAVVDVARHHGYPDRDKLAWAADIMAKKIDDGEALSERPMATGEPMRPRGEAVTSPPAATPPAQQPLTRPDEIRILLNTAKGHPSKRIQNAANQIFDRLSALRGLIDEDEQRHAEKRAAAAAKAAARAEIERLERELAEAKAKLRKPAETQAADAGDGEAHVCDEDGCDRTFPTAQGLRLHITRAHRQAAAS